MPRSLAVTHSICIGIVLAAVSTKPQLLFSLRPQSVTKQKNPDLLSRHGVAATWLGPLG